MIKLFFSTSFLAVFATVCGFLSVQAKQHLLSVDEFTFDPTSYIGAFATHCLHGGLAFLRFNFSLPPSLGLGLIFLFAAICIWLLALPTIRTRLMFSQKLSFLLVERTERIVFITIGTLLLCNGSYGVVSSSRIIDFMSIRPVTLAATAAEEYRAREVRASSDSVSRNRNLRSFYAAKFDPIPESTLSIYDPRISDSRAIRRVYDTVAGTTLMCLLLFSLSALLLAIANSRRPIVHQWIHSYVQLTLLVLTALFLSISYGYTRAVETFPIVSLVQQDASKYTVTDIRGAFLLAQTETHVTVLDRRLLQILRLSRADFPVLVTHARSSPFTSCTTNPEEFVPCESYYWD